MGQGQAPQPTPALTNDRVLIMNKNPTTGEVHYSLARVTTDGHFTAQLPVTLENGQFKVHVDSLVTKNVVTTVQTTPQDLVGEYTPTSRMTNVYNNNIIGEH